MIAHTVLPAAVRAAAERAVREDGVRAVVLFGSLARGTQGPDSDIDLALIAEEDPETAADALQKRLNGRYDIDVLTRDLRTLRESTYGNTVWGDIVREGEVIAGTLNGLRQMNVMPIDAAAIGRDLEPMRTKKAADCAANIKEMHAAELRRRHPAPRRHPWRQGAGGRRSQTSAPLEGAGREDVRRWTLRDAFPVPDPGLVTQPPARGRARRTGRRRSARLRCGRKPTLRRARSSSRSTPDGRGRQSAAPARADDHRHLLPPGGDNRGSTGDPSPAKACVLAGDDSYRRPHATRPRSPLQGKARGNALARRAPLHFASRAGGIRHIHVPNGGRPREQEQTAAIPPHGRAKRSRPRMTPLSSASRRRRASRAVCRERSAPEEARRRDTHSELLHRSKRPSSRRTLTRLTKTLRLHANVLRAVIRGDGPLSWIQKTLVESSAPTPCPPSMAASSCGAA